MWVDIRNAIWLDECPGHSEWEKRSYDLEEMRKRAAVGGSHPIENEGSHNSGANVGSSSLATERIVRLQRGYPSGSLLKARGKARL